LGISVGGGFFGLGGEHLDTGIRRIAALLPGTTILSFDLVTWISVFIGQPAQLVGNWLKDHRIAGGAWVLCGV
jgi:hypothetical protein